MAANTNFPLLNASKVTPMWGNLLQPLLDEGSLFVATNPVVGTAIATTTSVVDAGNSAATSAQVRPVMCILNGQAAQSNVLIYPLTLSMLLVQVPTTATQWNIGLWLEPVGSAMVTSGGSTIIPIPMNQWNAVPASKATITFGAIVAAPTTSGGKMLSRRLINPVIPVAADQWFFTFGGLFNSDQVGAGGSAKNVTFGLPPVAIPPGYGLKVGMWGASNAAAPSWEFELVYAERGVGQ